MAYVIKIKFEGSLRRLTVQNNSYGEILAFSDLSRRIRDLFQIPETADFVVTYTDSDGDIVTMANEHDLTDAMVQQNLNPLRLHVALRNPENITEVQPHVEDTEVVDAVDRESLNVQLRNILKTLPVYPDMEYMKQLFQPSEAFFENVKTPAQMKTFLENFVQSTIAHISSKPASYWNSVERLPNGTASTPSKVLSVTESPRQVDQAPTSPAGNSVGSQENVALPVHNGVVCDVCGMSPIVGLRWKAIKRYNYDLCNSCFEENGNVDEYTKLDKPMFRPKHLLNRKMTRTCPVHPHDRGMRAHPMGVESLDRQGWAGSLHGRGRQSCGSMRGSGARHLPTMRNWGGKLDARFVRDVTVFDGTEVAPGRHFTKIWRLRNSGDVAWPANTKLVHIGGDELGQMAAVSLEIPEEGLAPEAEMDASVDLVAPQKPGRYVSHWRLASPYGPKFGHRVWVFIQVLPSEVFEQPDVEYSAFNTGLADRNEAPVHTSGEDGESSSTLLGHLEEERVLSNNMPLEEWNIRPEQISRDVRTTSVLPLNQNAEESLRPVPQAAEIMSKDSEPVEKNGEKNDLVNGFSVGEAISAMHPMNDGSQTTEKEEAEEKKRRSSDKDDAIEAYFYNASESDSFSFLTERPMPGAERVGDEFSSIDEVFGEDGKSEDKMAELVDLVENSTLKASFETPAVESSPGAPAVESSPGAPAVESSPGAPPVESSPGAPPVESSPGAPPVESSLGAPAVESSPGAPAVESSLGAPAVESSLGAPAVQANLETPVVEASVEKSTIEAGVENFSNEASVEAGEREEEMSSPEALLAKLQAMGFTDRKLNLEILMKNSFDLRKTLDDLCTAEEWDPILEELEEMGFYDTDMNRRLMFKNNGSVKRVVKDLVTMDKNTSAGGKGKQLGK